MWISFALAFVLTTGATRAFRGRVLVALALALPVFVVSLALIVFNLGPRDCSHWTIALR